MLKTGTTDGRLRLFRYGLIVVVIVTFLVSLLAPLAATRGMPQTPPITDFLDEAVIFTVVVAVIAIAAYFVYRSVLTRQS
jgi:hypothetical protein